MIVFDTFDAENPPPSPPVVDPTQEEMDVAEELFRHVLTASAQPLEFGDTVGHDFHGNQWEKVGGKGEWTSTGGQPRLAPWEGTKGAPLPFQTTSMKGLPKDVQTKVMQTVRDRVASTQAISENLNHFMDTAMADPELRASGMNWYQEQHDVSFAIAEQDNIPPQNVAAALAAMSSGTVWSSEEPILRFMADNMAGNVSLSEENLNIVNAKLDAAMVVDRAKEVGDQTKDDPTAMRAEFADSQAIKDAWAELHPEGYKEASLNRPDNRLYGEIVALRENAAGLVPPSPDHITNHQSYESMDTKTAVLAMQRQFMEQPSVADGGTRATGWGAGHGWDGFVKGLTLLRGANVDDTLPGPKVRSFTNNIMDPTDPRDVTVDVHMVSAAARNPAIINDSGVMSSPSYQTASIGAYPYIADVVRRIADQNDVLPQQAQALMWVGYIREQEMALKKNQ